MFCGRGCALHFFLLVFLAFRQYALCDMFWQVEFFTIICDEFDERLLVFADGGQGLNPASGSLYGRLYEPNQIPPEEGQINNKQRERYENCCRLILSGMQHL